MWTNRSAAVSSRAFGVLRDQRTAGFVLLTAAALATSLVAAQPVECSFPGNQVVNCGFDTDLSGWTLTSGEFMHQPGDGFPQPGSLEVGSVPKDAFSGFEFEQVILNLTPAHSYELGFDVRVASGAADECWLTVGFIGSHWWDILFTPTSEWSRVAYTKTPSGPQASSVLFKLACLNFSAQPFSLRYDDALLRAVTVTWGSDVTASLGSCTSYVTMGGAADYGAVVYNRGPLAAHVDVVGTLPGACRWTCDQSPSATCTTGPVESGLTDSAYLPSGGSATYQAICLNVGGSARQVQDVITATLSATVVDGSDPIPENNTYTSQLVVVPPANMPYVKGDLTGDTLADLVLRHDPDWAHVVWQQLGSRRLGDPLVISPAPSPTWRLEGVDDFDGDRQGDLVFRDPTSGAVQFWLMNGSVRRGEPVPIGNAPTLVPEWQIVATGDFNYDGYPDLLWRNRVTQKIAIWTMSGTARVGALVPNPDQAVHGNWEIVGALDYDQDWDRDLLWYNSTSGKIVLWRMNHQLERVAGLFTDPPNAGDNNWKVLASSDYGIGVGGDGCTNDLVWRNTASGKLVLWYMDSLGNHRTSGTFTSPDAASPDPTSWTLTGPR